MKSGTNVRVIAIDRDDTDDGLDVGEQGVVHADDAADEAGLVYVKFGAMTKYMWPDQLEVLA